MRLRSLAIEVTNRCNLSCRGCNGKGDRPQGDMSWELYARLIDEAARMPKLQWVALFLGGEPMLHRRYAEMIRYAGSQGIDMVIATNGTMLTSDIAQAIVESKVKLLHLSIHGGGIESAREGIRLVRELRGEKERPEIRSNVIYRGQSATSLNLLYHHWGELSSPIELRGLIEDLRWVTMPFGAKPRARTNCYMPLRYAAVLWDGRLTICCRDAKGEMAMGQVIGSTILEQLHTPRMIAVRDRVLSHGAPDESACRRCKLWQTTYDFPALDGRLSEQRPVGVLLEERL